MEVNQKRVYHILDNSSTGAGNGAGGGAILSTDFGDWLDLPAKNANIFDEQILIQYKLDLMSYPNKAILYLVGQFGLNTAFVGSEIVLGVLPLNCRPKHQLKMDFTAKGTEIYLTIELNGEVKLQAVSGDLPVTTEENEPDPYFLNVDYNPQIEDGGAGESNYTAVRTQNFTRNNCADGFTGTSVSFSKTYTSNISQADANLIRANDGANFLALGQAFANDPGNGATCEVKTQWSATRTESFSRNNCGTGGVGTAVNFSKTYKSYISQVDADGKAVADADFESLGQMFANDALNGATCVYIASLTANFTRNNCGAGYVGTGVVFSKNYLSNVSQIDAQNIANANFNGDGQTFANNPANGTTCQILEFTASRTASFTRNNCGAGYNGTAVPFSKNYISNVSQIDAEAIADANFTADGQAFANDPGNGATCTAFEIKDYVLANDLTDRKIQITGDAIACDIVVTISYNINYYDPATEETSTYGEDEIVLTLPANEVMAITRKIAGGAYEKVNILNFSFTPKFCADKKVIINGQSGL